MTTESDNTAERPPRLPKFVSGLVVLAVIGVLFAMSGNPGRARKVVLGRNWPVTELISIDEIDHRDWDRLLQLFVDEVGNVDYAGWKESPPDVEALDNYLTALSRAEPERESSREARISFWINAYNALTIRGILREYPTAVVQNLASKPGRFDLWSDLLLHVGSADYSLGKIEHQLLRPLREPRIHFAIVCGSRGCPRLLNRAYMTGDLEQQLRQNSRTFFADPQKLEYDPSTGQLRLSPILKWYAKDFGESEADLLESIKPYLPDGMDRQIRSTDVQTDYLDYDWSLNEQVAPNDIPPMPPATATAKDGVLVKETD